MACTFRPSKDAEKAIEKIKRDHGLKTNSKALDSPVERFFIELQSKFKERAKNSPNERSIGQPHFNRGHDYLAPADFYNHRSRTFLKNKRKGL